MHGSFAAPRRPTATRAGRSSRRRHTSRRVLRDGRVVGRSARMGGGGARGAVRGGGLGW